MSLIETVSAAVNSFVRSDEAHDGVAVTTHCMYPSNAFVRIHIRAARGSFVVTDNGNTMFELKTSGVPVHYSSRGISNFLSERDLSFDNGVIVSPPVSIDFLPMMMLTVANSAAETASWLLASANWGKRKSFKEVVHELLKDKFGETKLKERSFVGESKKSHKFENVITFSSGKTLIVDAVVHDAASINARFVANYDVHNNKLNEKLEQRIIFDDEENWPNSDLSLLTGSGATVVPFKTAPTVMERLAATA
jgi:hypothetical protein